MDYELKKFTIHITFYSEMDTIVFKDKESFLN